MGPSLFQHARLTNRVEKGISEVPVARVCVCPSQDAVIPSEVLGGCYRGSVKGTQLGAS